MTSSDALPTAGSPTERRDAGRVVIVGGGLAGFSAAERLRVLGHTDEITIVEGEDCLYDRPPLSKELFAEWFDVDALEFATGERLADLGIGTRHGRRATAIDPTAASVTLDSGEVLPADTILLATGGRARTLPVPGADLPVVHVLRTLADAQAIRDAVSAGCRAVVIGGGLIGAELASALRKVGAAVTLVDPSPTPLAHAVGELMANHLHGMHLAHDVDTRLGVAALIEPASDGSATVVLAEGDRLPADLIVVGIGIIPNQEIGVAAGLDADDGILVDAHQRTSAPKVFAAGDVARRRGDDGVMHRREEHWEAAQLSGQAAAAGMLGLAPEVRGTPWFWSDRHGVHLEVVGRLSGSGTQIVREGGPHPAVFLIEDGLLVGAGSLDDANTVRAARRLIDQRIPVSADELADPAVSLRAMLRASR